MAGTLTPGATPNWTTTSTPAQRGTSTVIGYGLQPAAIWTCVPFARYDSTRIVSVDVFHLCGLFAGDEGIEKVEFIANNGSVCTVTEPSPHPETGLWTWWAEQTALATHGIVETRAIVYPWHGIPVVLQGEFKETLGSNSYLPEVDSSMLSWSNADGAYDNYDVWVTKAGNDSTGNGTEANPWLTIDKSVEATKFLGFHSDGSWVRHNIGAGVYSFPNPGSDAYIALKGWQTFTAAEGVDPDDVIIAGGVSGGSVRVRLCHFLNLNIRKNETDGFAFAPSASDKIATLWYEGVHHTGHDKWLAGDPNQGCYLRYNIASSLRRGRSTLAQGACRAEVLHNVDFPESSGDGLNTCRSARGNRMELIAYPGGLGIHGEIGSPADDPDHLDDWQSGGTHPNSIIGDNEFTGSKSQGCFWDRAKDRIYGFNNIHGCSADAGLGAISGGHGNGLFHCSLPYHGLRVVTDPTNVGGDGGRMEASEGFAVAGCIIGSLLYVESSDGHLSQAAYEAQIDASGDVQFKNDHYVGGGWFEGASPSNGAVTWADAETLFFPTNLSKVVPRTVRWDIHQNLRSALTLAGAMEYSAYVGVTETPTISPRGGIYSPTRPINVTLPEGATGYYTTNGAAPTNASTPITGPIYPPSDCTLKVIAYNEVDVPSDVASEDYQFTTGGTSAPPSYNPE